MTGELTPWLAVLLVACAQPAERDRRSEPEPAPALEMAGAEVPFVAAGGRRTGGSLIVASLRDRPLALIADEDARALRVVDPETRAEVATVSLPGRPAQVVVGGDGRAYVSLRDAAAVVAIEAKERGEMMTVGEIATAAEPTGLAVSPDGATLIVASSWGARVAAFAVPSRRSLFDVAVAREPRGVAVAGDHIYVSHALGPRVTRIPVSGTTVEEIALGGPDRAGDATVPRSAGQGFALVPHGEQVLMPHVLIHRGPEDVGPYGTGDQFAAHDPALAQIDGARVRLRVADTVLAPESVRLPRALRHGEQPCLLPRAVDQGAGMLFVACMGVDQVTAYELGDGDLTTTRIATYRVPVGPSGVAVDVESGWLHVWSPLARMLSSAPLVAFKRGATTGQPPRMTAFALPRATPRPSPAALSPVALSPLARRGRIVFHSPLDGRISADGRACASCHPDGRDDGMTWPTPHGARQTPMLAGRLGETGPYGWQGSEASLGEHLTQTIHRLGGRGLDGPDLEALVAYLRELPAPMFFEAPESAALVTRGETLFFDEQVGCATCHRDGGGSDGARHEVGSGVALDTPSLRFVSGTAPYFHDGRYATLAELLRGTKTSMGWAANLADDDLAALEAYLMTL